MTDYKRQQVIPPSSTARLPAVPSSRPSLPAMPTGGGFALTSTGQLRKDGQYLTLYSAKLRALADNAVAMRELIEKRDALALAISNLESLGERCRHQYEMGYLSRLHERQMLILQHEQEILDQKIRVAERQMELAKTLPIPEVPQPTPAAAPPAPAGFSVDDVVMAVDELTDHMAEIPPEARRHLSLVLSAYLKEKRK